MPTVPLSLFVDFMLMAGTGRIAHVRNFKKAGDVPSFYQPFVDALVSAHAEERSMREALDTFVFGREEERERRMFTAAERGYLAFLDRYRKPDGTSGVMWFEPPMRDYPIGPLVVRVAPEVGLLIAGRPHVVKLYFRGDPINPQQVALSTSLLSDALSTTWPGVVFSVLDVRRGRLFVSRQHADLTTLMKAEAATFSTLYAALQVDR